MQEVRRQRMAAAAEQRQREADARGVKDPQLLKEKQARREAAEKAAASQPASAEGGLRVWLCASGVMHCTYIHMYAALCGVGTVWEGIFISQSCACCGYRIHFLKYVLTMPHLNSFAV